MPACRSPPSSTSSTAGRGSETEGADCSGARAGNLYLQYWTYYADSATLRGVPIVGEEGYHHDDWESVQVRIGEDGDVDERASSHHGYNYRPERRQLGLGRRHRPAQGRRRSRRRPRRERLGPGDPPAARLRRQPRRQPRRPHVDRFTPGRRVHLIPLEPIAAADSTAFAISPPWLKHVWRDPEAEGTD